MDDLIACYRRRLNLQQAVFVPVVHEDAMVAIVYTVIEPTDKKLILKICTRTSDYLHEVYFLNDLTGRVPVPRIIQVVEPETGVYGAVLMECLPGNLLKTIEITKALAYEIGTLLARIHLNSASGYGDLVRPLELSTDPRVPFSSKFEEGFAECSNHLPKELLKQSRSYFDQHINLLASVDGPCVTHRDFRPGNIMVNDGKVQGIIDWSSARASFAQEDFCLMEHEAWTSSPANKKSFLAGYASVRPIPNYAGLMPLLRLSKALAAIGFLVKRGTWKSTHSRLYELNRRFLETLF